MKHFIAPSRIALLAVFLLALYGSARVARAVDVTWVGPNLGSYTVAANWMTAQGGNFVPESNFDEAAVINNNTTAQLNSAAPDVGGLRLGTTAGSSGGLRVVSGGRLNSVLAGGIGATETGAIQIGVAGQGNLTVLGGGTVTGTSISVAGSTNSSITLGDASGSTATLTTSGTANLGRITTVVGPNVNFNATGNLTLGGTGTLVADIRNATMHSALKTDGTATVGGTLRLMFTGFTPAAGNTWRLVDAAGTVNGNFSSVDTSGVSLPAGLALRVVPGMNGARNTRDLTVEEVLVLQVNRDTGAVSIANVGAQNKDIDGYSILSPNGWLTGAWNSLDDQNLGGANAWVEAGPTANALSELNPAQVAPGFTTVNAGSSLALGTPYDVNEASFPPFGTDPENLVFEYSGPNGRTIQGQVVYSGTKIHNDMILTVDPATGQVAFKNDSPYTLQVDGYNIASASASLDIDPAGGAWNSLQDQGVMGWEEASPDANALAELRATGALTLPPGTGFSLGKAFNVGAAQDLEFGFLQAGNDDLTLGTVVYGPFTPPPNPGGGLMGDYNNNGTVDAADYVMWRNDPAAFGGPAGYNTWRANFGRTGGAGSAAATAAVPEPGTLALLCLVAATTLLGAPRTRALLKGINRIPEAVAERRTRGMCDRGSQLERLGHR